MEDNKPVLKLSAEQECIQALSAIIAAVHFETTDPVTKQFVTMMVAQVSKEYYETTGDQLAPALFTPATLTNEFRKAMAIIRAAQQEEQERALEKARLFPKRKIEIGRK